jgi:tetratricopeptide (TPR) repeat protein
MLASLLLGLLEENTGRLYYINAEHPYLALYRDGAASFVEPELYLRKVGVELDQPLRVQSFHFRPGDVVFAGSDGRDDLLIGKSAEGQRVINEDETLFLRAIEGARGDLDGVRREILGRGELTDDLSLMRLAFREDQPLSHQVALDCEAKLNAARRLAAEGDAASALTALEAQVDSGPCAGDFAAEAASLRYRLRDFAGARILGERALELGGGDAALLRKLGFACKAQGDTAAALDYAERARLRDPDDANNLLNLADLHRLAGRGDAARETLELARRAGAEPARMREIETRLGRAVP